MVNQAFARKFNLGDHVIGTRVGTGRDTQALDIEIVGLVQDAKYSEVKGVDAAADLPSLSPGWPGRERRLDLVLRPHRR